MEGGAVATGGERVQKTENQETPKRPQPKAKPSPICE